MLYVAGKTIRGRVFQLLEVIGINELANSVIIQSTRGGVLGNRVFPANEALIADFRQ